MLTPIHLFVTEPKGDYLKQKIRQSEIYRSVFLPDEVDDDKIKTSYKNGVLEMTIPKQEKSQRKQIKVESVLEGYVEKETEELFFSLRFQ